MPIPYIPSTITVHLGPPDQWARNITVSFPEYVKNVASSEIYPTWEPAAIRANILAIISFALNRVYTEFYPSRGYDFQITSTTAYDQKFIPDRNIFENISQIVDEIFNNYIRKQGFVEPLSSKFCNGTTTTCDGLSQWGSQALAEQGYDSMQILRYYYGDDIELVVDAPIQDITQSYPGRSLRRGDAGNEVATIQWSLNRISQNYPAIPKIWPITGIFDLNTEDSVKQFQRIFGLTPDGIVGKATWYKLVYLYVGVSRLAELISQGQVFSRSQFQFPGILREGDTGNSVKLLQYMLAVLGEFDPMLSVIPIDGIFGPQTTQAVLDFQQKYGLNPDGIVGQGTWDTLYGAFTGIDFLAQRSLPRPTTDIIPAAGQTAGTHLPLMGQFPGRPLTMGQHDRKDVALV